MKKHMTST